MSLEQFSDLLSFSTHNFATLPAELLLASEGNLQTFYAPFDHVNSGARVVLCGITPDCSRPAVLWMKRVWQFTKMPLAHLTSSGLNIPVRTLRRSRLQAIAVHEAFRQPWTYRWPQPP